MRILVSLLALVAVTQVAQAQYYSSSTSCYAYTTCYDNYGYPIGQISCEVYGYQTVMSYGFSASNNCRWAVIPGVAVKCQGYQQVYSYGQSGFAWQNTGARCPGR